MICFLCSLYWFLFCLTIDGFICPYRNEFKRDGSGRGNWGSSTDEIAPLVSFISISLAACIKNVPYLNGLYMFKNVHMCLFVVSSPSVSAILAKIRETEENVNENEKKSTEKQFGEEDAADANKENAANETEEKEPENKVVLLKSQLWFWFRREVVVG